MSSEQEWQHVDEAINWIHSLQTLGIKPGLKRMEWMLERLDHPHRRLKYVHVGGTNGKGSTISFLRHVLEEAGYDVGTFTSPYLERFQNRIQVNGVDIPDDDLLKLTKQIKPLADELARSELGAPTEFEVVTMIAILYFAKVAYPDLVLWEVGLGGRLDSTNVVAPILSIITNVGHDHQHILGGTLAEIAREKAGIIKPGVHTVTAVQDEEALEVIKAVAKEKPANLYTLGKEYHFQMEKSTPSEQVFTFSSIFKTYEQIKIHMPGRHQLENASVAIMALELLKQFYAIIWEEEELYAGMAKARWKGRLETIKEEPFTIIDAAHNPEGMASLGDYLAEHYRDWRITVFFSALQDKAIEQMLVSLQGKVDKLIFTQFDFPRVAKAEAILEHWKALSRSETIATVAADWYEAYQEELKFYEQLTKEEKKKQLILFTGSLYFISEVRKRLAGAER